MAIYHLAAKIIKRSAGRSAIAAAAYRAGARMKDERTGLTHDYSKRRDVVHTELLTPDVVPLFAADRSSLWNAAEKAEKRKDAQLAREIELALPRELNREQQKELTRSFVQSNFVGLGMIADIAIHDKNGTNPHAHIMLTMRELTPEGFGGKVRQWNDKASLQKWRTEWEKQANLALEKAGRKERIDHRTLEAQGIDRAPQVHVGLAANAMDAKQQQSDRAERLKTIKRENLIQLDEVRTLQQQYDEITQLIEELEREQQAPEPERPRPQARPRGGALPKPALEQEPDPIQQRMDKLDEWAHGQTIEQEAQERSKRLDEFAEGRSIEEEGERRRKLMERWAEIEQQRQADKDRDRER